MKKVPTITRAELQAAREAFDEPLASPVFNPWPLQQPLEFIERALCARKEGLQVLRESGLLYAIFDVDSERLPPRSAFELMRDFGNQLSNVLDRVERDLMGWQVLVIKSVLERWETRLQT